MDLDSKQHAYCVAHTFLSARAALHAYYGVIPRDINNNTTMNLPYSIKGR